jgi:hypothetical protein
MFRIAALVSVAGCGGATTDTTKDSSSTESEPTTPPTSPTESVESGWDCNEWYPCQDCGGKSCGAEIGACAGDGACGAALNAWAACVLDCGNPEVCAAEFAAAGGGPADSLLTCVEGSCAAVCGL